MKGDQLTHQLMVRVDDEDCPCFHGGGQHGWVITVKRDDRLAGGFQLHEKG